MTVDSADVDLAFRTYVVAAVVVALLAFGLILFVYQLLQLDHLRLAMINDPLQALLATLVTMAIVALITGGVTAAIRSAIENFSPTASAAASSRRLMTRR